MKIFLDDQGDTERKSWVPEGWTLVKSADEFKKLVEDAMENGTKIDAIDFDNDLGEEVEGRHLVKWLQENHPEIIKVNPQIELMVHSQNNIAREALIHELDILKNHHKELTDAKNSPSYDELFDDQENRR